MRDTLREWSDTVVRSAAGRLDREVAYWEREVTRPWRRGGDSPAARAGRWIGLGLAVGTVILGVAAALRTERPWERR